MTHFPNLALGRIDGINRCRRIVGKVCLSALDIVLNVFIEAADIIHPSTEELLPGDLDWDRVTPLVLLSGQADRIGILEHPEFSDDFLGQQNVFDDSLPPFTVFCFLACKEFP